MSQKDIRFYCSQFSGINRFQKQKKERELRRIISKKFGWVLAVETKSGQLIGKIEARETAPLCVSVTVEFPNKTIIPEYGEEAIDQFLKICKETHAFFEIKFEDGNPIIERYKSKRSITDDVITIA